MAQEKKRFTFDDEDEIVEEEVQQEPLVKEEAVSNEISEQSSEEMSMNIEEPQGDKTMKKKKRKFKLRKWHIVLAIFVLLIGAFIVYAFASTSNDGPVYGDRCEALVSIDENKFGEVEQQMVAVEGIQSVKITKDCRIIEIVITYDDYVGIEDAQNLAIITLQTLDATLGQEKENEESAYSKVFGFANGRGQYNVNFRLRSSGENGDFPVFGTKQPKSDEVSFTKASPKDQEVTDRVKGATEQNNAEEQ